MSKIERIYKYIYTRLTGVSKYAYNHIAAVFQIIRCRIAEIFDKACFYFFAGLYEVAYKVSNWFTK